MITKNNHDKPTGTTMEKINKIRRGILKSVPAGAALALSTNASAQEKYTNIKFDHGVASGDPLQDRVIIWTRVAPQDAGFSGDISVEWEMSETDDFSLVVKNGNAQTNADRDFTVKVDTTGLKAGQKYFYRFRVGSNVSVTGETKTLNASGLDELNLAVVSCSNYPWGYFNGYRAIAESGPFDAVLHLGDYIYEYQVGFYQSPNAAKMGRLVSPEHEIKSLSDYRTRYALYRADEDLQEIHRQYPFITAWDDHEFANNAYIQGAQNHSDDEGDWTKRRKNAAKAYMEWMPVRVTEGGLPTVRSFEFGDLATLAMLDTRIVGRERPLEYGRDVEIVDGKPDYAAFHKRLETEERSLIGQEQEKWLDKTLAQSASRNVPWQILGQQIIMSYRPEPPLDNVFTPEEIKTFSAGEQLSIEVAREQGGFYNPDAWDGYQPARKRVLDMLDKHDGNPIVLTGDTHCAWAMSLTDKKGGKHYGAEFGVQGITSPGRGDRLPKVKQVEQAYYDHLDHMALANLKGRGYMTLKITPEETITNWYVLSTIESREFDVELRKSLKYQAGDVLDGKVDLIDMTKG
ncbi:alkaline phosphatase D family protein [Pseudemcibacter aquimaris]|uniref:alkaline phosphatase D family protein n=1 Tax=Pseudemcibacter aquimaris TaxID=2857064 RepID=UPI002012EB24|nr:alkaline phosphatase D family protein [Pseudemcibacter aquimaris]MCC3861577.1 alkaline phosphatase D family protein [Pseudemcibacter aquimaris]WDU58346.1 alkaline phosphatase D family protein [Pseudemcibacter aquimaris]